MPLRLLTAGPASEAGSLSTANTNAPLLDRVPLVASSKTPRIAARASASPLSSPSAPAGVASKNDPAAPPVCSHTRLPVSKSTARRPIGVWARRRPSTANGAPAGRSGMSRSANSLRRRSRRRASSGWRVSGTRYRGTRSGRDAETTALRAASPRWSHHSLARRPAPLAGAPASPSSQATAPPAG